MSVDQNLEALQRSWARRILLLPHSFTDTAADNALRAVVRHLGLPADWPIHEPLEIFRGALKTESQSSLEGMFGDTLEQNLLLVERHYSLAPVERNLLGFGVLLRSCPLLETLGQLLPYAWESDIDASLGMLLGHEGGEVSKALFEGALLKAGLIKPYDSGLCKLTGRFRVNLPFAQRLMRKAERVEDFAEALVTPVQSTSLVAPDFSHLATEIELAKHILGGEHAERRNILLVGPDGAGKTAFALHIAQTLGKRLVRPATIGDFGESESHCRAMNWRIAQSLYREDEDTFFLFDDLEDMSCTPRYDRDARWWDTLLESARTPMIWEISDADRIERALAMRFDLVLSIQPPSDKSRRRLLRRLTEGLAVEPQLDRLMDQRSLNLTALCRSIEAVRRAVGSDPSLDESDAMRVALHGFHIASWSPEL